MYEWNISEARFGEISTGITIEIHFFTVADSQSCRHPTSQYAHLSMPLKINFDLKRINKH